MRLLTYNVHGGVGRGGRSNAERLLALLVELRADVVALQEVQDDDEVARSFLRRLNDLGYPLVIHGPTMRKGAGAYGNVLLARHEALEVERIDLSQPGREPRGAIRACLDTPDGPVELLATHLGLQRTERERQVALLAQRLGAVDRPRATPVRIGVGDFNEWLPGSPRLRTLRCILGRDRPVRSFPAILPLLALDRVFVHPPEALRGISRQRDPRTLGLSDHLPLLADIDVAAGSERLARR